MRYAILRKRFKGILRSHPATNLVAFSFSAVRIVLLQVGVAFVERSRASMKTVVAIDGPAGAGKSTVARQVAKKLGYTYVDTGAMYRAVALLALQQHIDHRNGQALAEAVTAANMNVSVTEDHRVRITLHDTDVTDKLRSPEVSQLTPMIAEHAEIRNVLVALQRRLAAEGRIVMDGRDIGSFVVPDAGCKFYLTASEEVRGRRRWLEYLSSGGREQDLSLEDVQAEIVQRDRRDQQRTLAPLRRAPDAILIDSSELPVDEVVDLIVQRCQDGCR